MPFSLRLAFNIALLISMLFAPWWLFAIILLVAFFVSERFFEGVIWGLVADVLYGSPWGYHGFSHLFLFGSAFVLVISLVMNGKLSWQR